MESQQTAFGPDPGAEGGLALAVPILRGAGGRAVGALVARLPPERLRALPEAAGARAAWLAEGEPAPTPLLWLRRDGEAEASGPGFATAQRRLARDPRLILVAVAELPAPEMSAPAALPPEAQAVPDPSPRGAPETAVSPLLPGLIGLLVGGLLAALLLRRPPREAARLARQDAEEARRALAELRAICETIPVGLALLDAGAARLLSSNARLAAFAGLPPDALAGRPAADVLPPALAEVLLDAHARVLREGRPVLDLQVAAEAGGALRNIRQLLLSCHPVRAGDGRIEAVSAVVQDVTERARAEASRDLLVKELNHRVKNCLATVLTIAHQTLRGAGDDLGTFERSFSARIRALARAHDLLTLNAWHEADLGAVARAALAPWLEDPRLRIEPGPEVLLRPAQAQALVLAFNELATNAAKYGALTRPEGDVWLRWSLDPEGMVLLRWSESGGPPVPPRPARRGFGTRLLEQALSRDLGSGAEPTLLFDPEGLHANIRFRPRLCENVAFGAGWRQEGRPGDRRKGQRLPSGSGG
jgi:PAS domain S-box-containing protein